MVDSTRFNDWYLSSRKSFKGAEILFKSADPDVDEVKKCLEIARKVIGD